MYKVKNMELAGEGRKKIEWAWDHMPVMKALEKDFSLRRPFKGIRISLSIHMEAKTACLVKTLLAGGAEVRAAGSNPLSTQDDVAACLAGEGAEVFACYGCTPEEYLRYTEDALSHGPHIVIDDGGDLVNMLHTTRTDLADDVMGGCEETTTGVMRLKAMERKGILSFPMIAVNDARSKYLFDNRYGTGQSVFDGIDRTTNLIIAGKDVVIAGYGWCGKGVAMRAKGLGARVIITEVDAVKAAEAYMDGFRVMSMDEASCAGDIFITVTGCRDVITAGHFLNMKEGAILCNAGHFDVEISIPDLESVSDGKEEKRRNITGYRLKNGRNIYLLASGRLVNLAAGDGHPAEIMDLSFALQLLSAEFILENHKTLGKAVIEVPSHIDELVARMKLDSWGLSIDRLTGDQEKYLGGWG